MAKKTIAAQVTENASVLTAFTSHTDLRNWAINNGMDSASGFSNFKKALLTIGIDYDALKTPKHAPAPAPVEVEETPKSTIEIIAEMIYGKVWIKGDKRRIYVEGGNNYHYQGKWYVDFKEDGSWTVECWLEMGRDNKNAAEYIAKHKKMIAEAVTAAEQELNAAVETENINTADLPQSECISKTLACEPVAVVVNEYYSSQNNPVKHVARLSDTEMIQYYHGAGTGYAYIRNNKVIAFRYGLEKVANEPADCKRIRVDFSCTEICFENL